MIARWPALKRLAVPITIGGLLVVLVTIAVWLNLRSGSAPRTASTPHPAIGTLGTGCSLLPREPAPSGAQIEFKTDFATHCVPYREILSGGISRDGIPAIDHPKLVSVADATTWLKPVEPVIAFQIGDDVRAYPIQIMIWHEIVNDTVDSAPVAITFCPLCNTDIVFERTVAGHVLDFGTTGRLRYSNLVMYDRPTQSWWQQALGLAIAGSYTGTQLATRPSTMVSWAEFKAAYPNGRVLSRDTGYRRPYGQNPYVGYDDIAKPPFLYQGPDTPGTLPAVARVLTVLLHGEAVAYPYDTLKQQHVVNDTVGGTDIVVLWATGTASPFTTDDIAGGPDVGSATMYSRAVNGQDLSFTFDGITFKDTQTGSTWTILGQATAGPLQGTSLTPIVSGNSFWFAWAVFQPQTRVYQRSSK